MEATGLAGYLVYVMGICLLAYMLYLLVKSARELGARGYEMPYDMNGLILKKPAYEDIRRI
jgi:hypothetical protein